LPLSGKGKIVITYTVRYRRQGQVFWRKLRNIAGDSIQSDLPTPTRILFFKDNSRLEIPLTGTEFWFSKGRFDLIVKRMSDEAGQPISLKENP
jgi:hypothetical protein